MIAITEISKLAFRSLLRNKTRSILTMLGIIIGVSAVILLVSIGQGLQNYLTSTFESLGSNLITVLPGQVGQGGFSAASSPKPVYAAKVGKELQLPNRVEWYTVDGDKLIDTVSGNPDHPVTFTRK